MTTKDQKATPLIISGATTFTIEAGQSESSVFFCGYTAPTGLIFPANWTARTIKFWCGKDPTNLAVLASPNDGTEFGVLVDTNSQILMLPLLPILFNSVRYFKLVGDGAQVEKVTIDTLLAPIYGN